MPIGSPFFKRIIKEYKLLFELLKGKMMNKSFDKYSNYN